jgi:uncharacterized protein (TIGR03437 family)
VLVAADLATGNLPKELNYSRVYVDNYEVGLFYVSPTQINFLIPITNVTGRVKIQVFREGTWGPDVYVELADGAPATFVREGFAVATHADNSLVTPDSPARAGEIVVLYCTGLGKVRQQQANNDIAGVAAVILNLDQLKVFLGQSPIDPVLLKYAGLSPGYAGLYQINFEVPPGTGENPEIRVSMGAQSTPAGLKLAVK